LSVDADHDTETEVVVAPVAARLPGAVGGEVSLVGGGGGHALVGELTVACVERLPAASYASTPIAYVVPHTRPVKVALVDAVEPVELPAR
jgi:hypothetical protein